MNKYIADDDYEIFLIKELEDPNRYCNAYPDDAVVLRRRSTHTPLAFFPPRTSTEIIKIVIYLLNDAYYQGGKFVRNQFKQCLGIVDD